MQNYHLGAYDHRFGIGHTTSSQRTSSFLLHTPPEALRRTVFTPSRYSTLHFQTQTPASILMKKRLNKQRTTTMQTITTTQLRGDQQPQIDEYNHEDFDEFIPLGVRNQPITVHPIYSINDRDKTEPRIPINIDCHFLFLLLLLHQFNVSSIFSNVSFFSFENFP